MDVNNDLAARMDHLGGVKQQRAGTDVVEMNVGGVQYTTLTSTLTRYRESPLADLADQYLGGQAPTDTARRLFLDRDGQIFRYILHFLRTNQVMVPDSDQEVEMLKSEAEYYQIPQLVQLISKTMESRRYITVQTFQHAIKVRGNMDIPELAEMKRVWSLLNQGQNIRDPTYVLYECSKERGALGLSQYTTLLMEKKHPQNNAIRQQITNNEKEWLVDMLQQRGWLVKSRSIAAVQTLAERGGGGVLGQKSSAAAQATQGIGTAEAGQAQTNIIICEDYVFKKSLPITL